MDGQAPVRNTATDWGATRSVPSHAGSGSTSTGWRQATRDSADLAS